MTEKRFHIDNETTYMINTSKDKLIQFMKYKGKRSIRCFIIDELPLITESEDGVVYVIINSIANDGIAHCQFYTVVDDMWLTASWNVDISIYLR